MASERVTPPVFNHQRARKAALASFVGTAVEWYDFYIYATAAALVFSQVFFPEVDHWIGIMASFATYAIGFLFRPLGAIIAGHIGDRYGRKPALVLTLMTMGIATVLVGVLPTYQQVGILAPCLLLFLRIVQGLAVGGEWGGAVLMTVESAPEKHKTFYGGFVQLGNSAGALLATGIFALLTLQGEQFLLDGGWRIPFLLSIVLIGLGMWVRSRLEESPVFEATRESAPVKSPLRTAVRGNWKTMLLTIGAAGVGSGGYYITTTFATAYSTEPGVNMSSTAVLAALSAASLVEFITTLGVAWLGDRFGRRLVLMVGIIGSGVLVAPQFLAMESGNAFWIFVTFIAMRLLMTATYAPGAAFMAQAYRPQARYSSLSLANSIASALWGGFSPIIAAGLYAATHSIWSVIIFFLAIMLVTAVCTLAMPQYRDEDALGEPTVEEALLEGTTR